MYTYLKVYNIQLQNQGMFKYFDTFVKTGVVYCPDLKPTLSKLNIIKVQLLDNVIL